MRAACYVLRDSYYVLSIGPVDLTSGTVANNQPVPTVTDNLFSQGTISVESIGISYEPAMTANDGSMNGELTFGWVDSASWAVRADADGVLSSCV